jgi:hypothetical protein
MKCGRSKPFGTGDGKDAAGRLCRGGEERGGQERRERGGRMVAHRFMFEPVVPSGLLPVLA